MPRTFFASDGSLYYRTRLLPYDQAERFARLLKGNATRFVAVDVLTSDKAKGDKIFFVSFQPRNPDRVLDMADRQQESRRRRADDEGADYLFMLDCDGRIPQYWVFNPHSGETYQLDSSRC